MMQSEKQMKIMAEYGSTCLRLQYDALNLPNSFDCLDYETITKLIDDEAISFLLLKYDRWYQSTYNKSIPQNSGFRSFKELLEFEEMGYNIWIKLIQKFGMEYDIYFDSILKSKLYFSVEDYLSIKHVFGGYLLNGEKVSGTLHGIVFTPDEVKV